MGCTVCIDSKIAPRSYLYFDVTLKFPVDQPAAPVFVKKLSKTLDSSKPNLKYKVLFVEDDAQVQKALFKTLVDAGGFFIDVVSDGALVVE